MITSSTSLRPYPKPKKPPRVSRWHFYEIYSQPCISASQRRHYFPQHPPLAFSASLERQLLSSFFVFSRYKVPNDILSTWDDRFLNLHLYVFSITFVSGLGQLAVATAVNNPFSKILHCYTRSKNLFLIFVVCYFSPHCSRQPSQNNSRHQENFFPILEL